ncbi:hypothetical protein [Gemella massiliensis]|uniref:hypothetical protein n=1 Tax=Gemella massiliensis TaxID=1909670 RepID=UPI000931BC67|nr:hypothetical protein [Gemella massiliensis]
MSEEKKQKAKEIRNAKDRNRYAENEESRQKTIYRRGKSATFKFLKIAKEEHLREIKKIVEKKLK